MSTNNKKIKSECYIDRPEELILSLSHILESLNILSR
jgi:hypothetical protein